MSIDRYRSTTASDNVVVYLQNFDKSVSIIEPDTKIPDISGFDVEATIFVNADEFRSQFLIDTSQNLFKCISGNINLREPKKEAFVDINPTKANAAKYTDMCENYIHFNGSSPYNDDAEDMSISNSSTYFKVCHDYATYLVKQSLGNTAIISDLYNANLVIADILSKGQKAVTEFLGKLKAVNNNLEGYDICYEIATQIAALNEHRLEPSGNNVKYQLKIHDSNIPWQELPLISGDVVCFKFTCNDISGTDITENPINIPSRTYLIKLCLIDHEDDWARNLPTQVDNYDSTSGDTIFDVYNNMISKEYPDSVVDVHDDKTTDILKDLSGGQQIVEHYRETQYVPPLPLSQ
jgi:hypothetical protein